MRLVRKPALPSVHITRYEYNHTGVIINAMPSCVAPLKQATKLPKGGLVPKYLLRTPSYPKKHNMVTHFNLET